MNFANACRKYRSFVGVALFVYFSNVREVEVIAFLPDYFYRSIVPRLIPSRKFYF